MKNNKLPKNKKVSNDLLPAVLVMVSVRYLWQKGNNFVNSCLQLEDLDSRVVLSTLAIELLVKSNIGAEICIKSIRDTENIINQKINKKFYDINHNFIKLFNNALKLKKEMNIERIERVNNTGFIDEYRIKLNNEGFPLLFKTLEASRYGSFSSKRDVIIFANRSREEKFLKKLAKVTSENIRSTFKYLENTKTNEN